MSVTTIDSIQNALDGTTALASVSGQGATTASFQAARVPIAAQAQAIAGVLLQQGPPAVWRLALPHTELWYVWIVGEAGAPIAVWVSASDDQEMDEIGVELRNVLKANQPGIEAIMRQVYPDSTIKQIAYGSVANVDQYPSLVIGESAHRPEWIGTGFTRLHTYSYTIRAMDVHEDEESDLQFVNRISGAITRVLNNPYYENMTLPSGLFINHCQAMAEQTGDVAFGQRFSTRSVVRWSCESVISDGSTAAP